MRIGSFSSSLTLIPSTQIKSSKNDNEYNYDEVRSRNRTRTRSKQQRDLLVEQLKYPKEVDDDDDNYDEYTYEDYYEDENEDDNDNYQEEEEEEDDEQYDNDYDKTDESNIRVESNNNSARGNFWSNPQRSFDSYTPSSRQRSIRNTSTTPQTRDIRRGPSSSTRRESSKRMRKTFRSGNPPPPNIIKEFYDKLFWYGFDADETTSAADRTMFGGTKGKFNGLNLLEDINRGDGTRKRLSNRNRRNTSFEFLKDDDYDDDFFDEYDEYDEYNNDDYDYDEYKDEEYVPARTTNRNVRSGTIFRRSNGRRPSSLRLPPSKSDKVTIQRQRSSSPRTNSRNRRFNVDNWFDDEDEDVEERDDFNSSPLINMLDKVFQIDPNEVKYQADDYNRRIGLNRKKRELRSRMGSKSISQKRTRKGYAYPYVQDDDDNEEENEDDLYEIIEVDPSQDIDFVQKEIVEKDPSSQDDVEKNVVESKLTKDVNVIDVEAAVTTPIPKIAEKKGENRINSNRERKKQSWEDRAASYERIPPKGVMAWGPDGEMDVDARTYAATCALEEIENAKTVFSKKEEAVNEAEQNLIELKRELSVLKKELLEEDNRRRSSMLRDEIRVMNFDIDEGSRRLRRAKSEALLAIDKLEETELRHWTLLRQYEADQQLEVMGNSTKYNEEQEDKI